MVRFSQHTRKKIHQILELAAQGLSGHQISTRLAVSRQTVATVIEMGGVETPKEIGDRCFEPDGYDPVRCMGCGALVTSKRCLACHLAKTNATRLR
jgi:hypothetical protein